MKITGLDTLTRKIKELEKAVANLDGDIASLTFDPNDPQSIEQAIQKYCVAIDKKTASYAHNDIVASITKKLKEYGREKILEQASKARLKKENNE